ncbi:hypothetical protein FRB94_007504 [Tulasnella sp. JGI-2019a]|nr:hypothetical protein FRB93_007142 [Tulasnella sp. JGI-2019a]KAG8997673.1 hypothetical protein FRB94_007504 [Tulasnella sp. JGI-2019a]KAG9029168.1 hypothetical protein FRB95_005626 [Tulasnella sp. JGI-2019a]
MLIDSNTFYTGELPQLTTQTDIPIRNSDVALPIGINFIDLNCNAHLRVRAYADNYKASSATIHTEPWAGNVLNAGGCTWLEVGNNDRDFQHGVFSTTDDHPWDKPQLVTSRDILFNRAFAQPPNIVCWINSFAIDHEVRCRVKTYAKDITRTGFTLYISTWEDSLLYFVNTTWIAYPANRNNITSGCYNTAEVRPREEPGARCERDIAFDKAFEKVPLVLTAFNMLDFDIAKSIKIKTSCTNVTEKGMTWHLDTWEKPIQYAAGASYLAIQEY